MGLLEDLEFLKKQRKPNLLANTRQLQGPAEPYLRQQYPEVYGALGGLLGMAPDEMAGSVLDPNTARVRAGAEYGFPVGTAAQVLPMAQPAQAAAMAAGQAGERLAGRVVPQIMERGGVGADILQGMSRGTVSPMDVYHGSPHKFDRFDASKIGTGEGAQAYGHGIYTAENPGTAQVYKDTLAYKAFDVAPEAEKLGLKLNAGARGEFIRQARVNKSPEAKAKSLQNANIAARDLPKEKLAELFKAYEEQGGGNLYKVDLPDEKIAKMLDWDKPLNEQSPYVQAAIKASDHPMMKYWAKKSVENSAYNGADLLTRLAGEKSDRVNASELLRQAGIPGIKYLDATSRGAGTGTRNFVTFPGEEQNLTILERNGQPMVARTQQQDATPDLMQYQQMLDDEERRKSAGLLFR